MAQITENLRTFLLNELETRDLGSLTSLKLAATGQTMEARADSVVLMRAENRRPLGPELREILEAEWESMTQLEVDVSNIM